MSRNVQNSVGDRLGRWGVVRAVWHAIPWQFRLLSFPYYLPVYSRLLAQCDSVSALKKAHTDLYDNRTVFWFCRPRYRLLKAALLPLEVETKDETKHEGAATAHSATSGLSGQLPTSLESVPVSREDEHGCLKV